MKKIIDAGGLFAIVLINTLALPAIFTGEYPPVFITAQYTVALLLLCLHSCYHRLVLYSIGNILGFTGQFILLILTLARG